MTRYRIDCAFHGAGFHGWQRQPGLRTVQGEMELWLGRILGHSESVAVVGAGRTDAGVHAEHMVAHFDWERAIEPDDLIQRLTVALPNDLTVRSLTEVDPDFHARYSAIRRSYDYRIVTVPSPFERDRSWFVVHDLDRVSLSKAASEVMGRHDFRGFCLAESQKDDCHCEISVSEWECHNEQLRYHVAANRFLHQMVRLLVGTMVDVARSRFDADRIRCIIDTGDVRMCGSAAPPQGLTLQRILYPGDVLPGREFS